MNHYLIIFDYRYLFRVGLKRVKSLLSSGGDTDLLEQIVQLLTINKDAVLAQPVVAAAPTTTANDSQIETVFLNSATLVTVEQEQAASGEEVVETQKGGEEAESEVPRSAEELLLDLKLRVRWLKAISEFSKFDLMVQFSSQSLLVDVVEILASQTGPSAVAARTKYQKGVKL